MHKSVQQQGVRMRLNFLCDQHCRYFAEDCLAARAFWVDCHCRLCEEPIAPTPYGIKLAGSALEAAGIYLRADPHCETPDITRYGESALHLVRMLAQLGERRLALVVVAGADALLRGLAQREKAAKAASAVAERLRHDGLYLVDNAGDTLAPGCSQRAPQCMAVTVH